MRVRKEEAARGIKRRRERSIDLHSKSDMSWPPACPYSCSFEREGEPLRPRSHTTDYLLQPKPGPEPPARITEHWASEEQMAVWKQRKKSSRFSAFLSWLFKRETNVNRWVSAPWGYSRWVSLKFDKQASFMCSDRAECYKYLLDR